MLQHLFIKDLAVVSFVDMYFHAGMTVITGETGAGKSIILDALALVLGERAESQIIRPGSERAEITATFDIASLPGAILWLTDCALTGDSPQQCIIRRVIFANGRSRAFINGCPVTTQQLRLLGEHLVQIHGQHQHQLLLKSTEQLRLLDAYQQHDALVSQVKTTFKTWEKLQQRKRILLESADNMQAQNDLLQYQIAELDALDLGADELALLYQEHDTLAHAESTLHASEQALSLLTGEEEGNILQCITKAQLALRPCVEKSKDLQNAQECLENARIQIEESVIEINHFTQSMEINPQKLTQIEKRLEHIHEIARKHKIEPAYLYTHHSHLQSKANQFADSQNALLEIDQEIVLAEKQYQRYATQLSASRQQAAEKFMLEVTQCIQHLGMPGAVFTITLIPHTDNMLHATGNESILFGISANPGHPPQPLHKVASGGELSRISLALELIVTKYLATPCLVFDEVDVGISGKIGALVGKALFDLSANVQVLCITHLPQVAAFGHHHIQVTKNRLQNSTETTIQALETPQRIEEIARMLGGIDVTTQARAHAQELLGV